MSKRDARLLLNDILLSIAKIERYVGAMDREQFLHDEKTTDAVARNIEIIGQPRYVGIAVDAVHLAGSRAIHYRRLLHQFGRAGSGSVICFIPFD